MVPTHRAPTHPGEILRYEFLEPLEMTQQELADQTGMTVQRVNTLVRGKRGVSADTAVLLSEVFGTTPEFWMQLQNAVDLYAARKAPRPRK